MKQNTKSTITTYFHLYEESKRVKLTAAVSGMLLPEAGREGGGARELLVKGYKVSVIQISKS